MFQKCGNSINLPPTLPLDVTIGAQIVFPDLAVPSSWYSLDAQLSILGMLPQIQ